MAYTVERVIKIYNDNTGDHIYIGPDADGLSCVEIRNCDANERVDQRVFMTVEQALLVAKAIVDLYGDK